MQADDTWKTLGADTKQAKADESVAPKIPAVMRGLHADTKLIVYKTKQKNILFLWTQITNKCKTDSLSY